MSTVSSSPVPSTNPTTATAAATGATQPPSSESLTTCRYPSKKCWNTRALKRNGEMHNLCELHRQKANKNQRRLELKRKVSKKTAASAKRARKSRAAAKGRAGTVRVSKIQQQQKRVGAATTVANAARTLQQQSKAASKLAALTVVMAPAAQLTAPPGFFTDLMLSEPPVPIEQFEPTQLQHASGLMWPVVTTQHPHVLLGSQLHVAPQVYRPAPLPFEVDEFFDADTDVDSLVAYLDAHPYTTSSSLLTAPTSAVGGGSSPIDVCDGLDAIAAVSDFRWHPVVMASAAELFQDASNDELRLQRH